MLFSLLAENLQRLVDSGCIRGVRHRLGYPVRGQNTRTNAVTASLLNRARLNHFGVNLSRWEKKTETPGAGYKKAKDKK